MTGLLMTGGPMAAEPAGVGGAGSEGWGGADHAADPGAEPRRERPGPRFGDGHALGNADPPTHISPQPSSPKHFMGGNWG